MKRLLLAIAGIGVAILLLRPVPWLVLTEVEDGGRIAAFPLAKGEPFEICYIHSVDQKPVCEVFRLEEETGIILQETYFRMFGAGMGHWQGHGTVIEEKGWIKIKGINRTLGSFILRVGSPGVDHTLAVRDERVNLSEKAAGKRVLVAMEKRSRIFSLLR